MVASVQSSVINFLSRPESYGGDVTEVDKVETHISVLFLAGDRVFKLKRAVEYPYLDFSTLDRRRRYCEAEVVVNTRTAPSLYKGCIPVTRSDDGSLFLGGGGEVVEWLVEMSRFDEETLFDRLAQAGRLRRHLMGDLAEEIARFHMAATPCSGIDSLAGLETTITGNRASFEEFGTGIFSPAEIDQLTEAQRIALQGSIGQKIRARNEAGLVRHCHGDLHLRNICLIDGQPTLFDAIEFNETFANIDVFYDLSFLLMDLDHRGLRRLANIVLNRYLDATGDTGGLGTLPFYQSLRAAIRAHVGATAAGRHSDATEAARLAEESRAYFRLALDYLAPSTPRLVAVGGLSGSGKSRMGRELAPSVGLAPGARIARSDVLRKRLLGVDQLTKLEAASYTPEMSERTYKAVFDETRKALAEGHSVVADAVFSKPEERRAIADVAKEMNVPFDGLWLEAPQSVMEQRVATRKHNPSDADASVVRLQLGYDLGEIDWVRLDSSGKKEKTLEKGLEALGVSIVTGGVKGA